MRNKEEMKEKHSMVGRMTPMYGNLRVNKITCRTSCSCSTVCTGFIEWALTSTSSSGSCCSADQILHRHSQKRRVLHRLLSLIPLNRSARSTFPSTPPISIDGPSSSRDNFHVEAPEVLHVHRSSSCDERTSYVTCLQLLLTVSAGHATTNILPDDVLLNIFDFIRVIPFEVRQDRVGRTRPSWWHPLVHVCQRWRTVIFASPKFLDLTLVCGYTTRTELLGIWPPLPIIIRNKVNLYTPEHYNFDSAIMYRDRVREINLFEPNWGRLQRAMQVQFPALIHLGLGGMSPVPALPDQFLGGSALSIQSLSLNSIPFPALPKLLLSATHLVRLSLRNIPHSWYISPEAIITGLAVSVNLKSLIIEFESPLSRPIRESRPLPPTRTILPAFTRFVFEGVSEYLEDFMARIDAPLLGYIRITFADQLVFDIAQLAHFTRRTTAFQGLDEAHLRLTHYGIQVESLPLTPPTKASFEMSVLSILCKDPNWQLPSLAQLLTSLFPFIRIVEHLYIDDSRLPLPRQRDIDNMEWLEVFRPFSAVRNLYVSADLARRIAPALQDFLGERVVDALPALNTIFVEKLTPSGSIPEAFGQFVAARQLLGHPVTVSHWDGV